jgi:hypothetical protein
VTLDASGSSDPEGLGLRYEWDLDGNGSFETAGGGSPTVTESYSSSTTLTARVRVTDPHGATASAGTLVRVDGVRPVISQLRVRGATITYRLSEPAHMTIRLQRRAGRRWRLVRTLQQNGVAGRNRLTPRVAARASKKRTKKVRYRAEAVAVDAVGNRSRTVRLKVSAAAAKKLRRRR